MLALAAFLLCRTAMAAEEPVRVRAEPIAATESVPTWRGPQFLQADNQRRVFLLNGKDEIVAGDGQVKWASRSEEDWKRLETLAEENKFPFRRSGVSPVQETAVIRAMTVGRDGRVYLLTETPEGLALDRFDPDPVRQVLERALLSGIGSGRYSIAAGRHALYIAAQLGNGGRWRLPWETLDAAKWELVKDTVVNGQPTRVAETPAR